MSRDGLISQLYTSSLHNVVTKLYSPFIRQMTESELQKHHHIKDKKGPKGNSNNKTLGDIPSFAKWKSCRFYPKSIHYYESLI